ncbi:MAG: choice-of-anchor tandem repeat NxxGxxAF-containing protein [Pseudomonadota bacterium]
MTANTQILVQTADPSPDGNGVFGDAFGVPLLNDAGQAAFWARLLATQDPGELDDQGLYLADTDGLATLARGGQPSAAGNLLRLDILEVSVLARRVLMGIDAAGSVAFLADDDQDMDAIYRSDGNLSVLVQEGQDLSFGTNLQLGPAATGFLVNDSGDLAYRAIASSVNVLVGRNTEAGDFALFTSDQALPGGGTLQNFRDFAFNQSGTVLARLNTSNSTFGYFSTDGTTEQILMQTGQAAPDGLGSFNVVARVAPAINANGAAALVLGVDDVMTDYVGLFTGDAGGLTERLRTGDSLPGGQLAGFIGGAVINGSGDVVFTAQTGGLNRLFQLRGAQLRVIAQPGDVLDELNGALINNIEGWTQNELGQVAFSASVVQTGVPQRRAVFLHDPALGRVLLVAAGEPFTGDTLTEIGVALPQWPFETNTLENAQTGLNNEGQVVFSFALLGGGRGIALATVERVLGDLIFRDSFEMSGAGP